MNVPKLATAGTALAAILVAGLLTSRSGVAANDKNTTQDEKMKIQIGAQIAPVTLKIGNNDPDTVYLGSYIVNATALCNECHTSPSYAVGGNPFLGQAKVINATGYMGGGRVFAPTITSRNITPDASGKPAGMSYSDFVQVMRTGIDFDHVHGANVPLQVMPWPVYQNMTDRDLNSIYTYLSTIPCLEGDPGVPGPPSTRCH